jgi:uncharacterized NAD(P)/FAD-binding protein YdhS
MAGAVGDVARPVRRVYSIATMDGDVTSISTQRDGQPPMRRGDPHQHDQAGVTRSGGDDGPTVVIIGGGFSGTVTAVHLLRRGFGIGGRVLVVNRSGAMARGVAYGTNSDQHVLNVPAGRMSALEDDADSFVRFLHRRGVAADGGSFVSRHLYGAYLEALLVEASERAREGALVRLNAEVTGIEPAADDTHAWVSFGDGSRVRADRVVLAIGNYPPQDPSADGRECFASARYVRDPWSRDAFAAIDRQQPIVLVGSGLTMVDIALQLHAIDAGEIVAISRHGLLPQPHRSPAQVPETGAPLTNLVSGPSTTRAYVRAVRGHIREAAMHGVDWRDVIAALRPLTPGLWQQLPMPEQARFLRHVRPFWDVHRHRMAPQLSEAFDRLRDSGQVKVFAARLVSIRERADGLRVELRLRGTSELRVLDIGTLVNCSGPAGDTRRLRDTLFENLQAHGLLKPDVLGLGIETSPSGTVIGRDGTASRVLYYVGPFLRARDWEATAVPELRRATRLTVDHLLAHMTTQAAPAR